LCPCLIFMVTAWANSKSLLVHLINSAKVKSALESFMAIAFMTLSLENWVLFLKSARHRPRYDSFTAYYCVLHFRVKTTVLHVLSINWFYITLYKNTY
jgi:hypothetical protein